MEQCRLQIQKSGFGFFGFQIQRILFENGFPSSKIRVWIHGKERQIRFKIENLFLDSPKGTHPQLQSAFQLSNESNFTFALLRSMIG